MLKCLILISGLIFKTNHDKMFFFQDCDGKVSYEEFSSLVMGKGLDAHITEKLTIDKAEI